MMISEQNIGHWAEQFLHHELSSGQQKALEEALSANASLKEVWEETLEVLQLMEDQRKRKAIKDKIKAVRAAKETEGIQKPIPDRSSVSFGQYWRPAGIAAALVLISCLATFWIVNNKTGQTGTQYQFQLLRREIETIKHSQSQLLDSIKNKDANEPDMAAHGPVFGGTGFALSNDGFIATNYHVVKDANTIYIQTADGSNLKAYIFAFEPSSDVAILKIEDQHFRFGQTPLPYTLKHTVSGLGQKVFSVGYPQENLVYNEGYISCEKGFDDDSSSYQLEMVANPGQSGAPVLDQQGNVIALITGKQSNTPGKTYAVHSGALLQLINTLPRETKIKLSSGNKLHNLKRPQQVDKLREYVCAVKVN